MFKGSKRKHSEGADGEDDGGDVQKRLAKQLQVYIDHLFGLGCSVKAKAQTKGDEEGELKIPTDELIADAVYPPQKPKTTGRHFDLLIVDDPVKKEPFTATEAMAQLNAGQLKFIASMQAWTAQYAIRPGTPQMSLQDSETGKVVKKLKRRFRPVVKSTKPLPGWRVWLAAKSSEGDLIQSVAANYNWLGPVALTKKSNDGQPMRVAVNNPAQVNPDDAIHLDYGIYSYKTPKLLQEHQGIIAGYIVGRLDSYGHVVEHECGYRAQKVIVRELWVITSDFSPNLISIEDLSLRYDCPVHLLPEDKLTAWIDYHTEEAENV